MKQNLFENSKVDGDFCITCQAFYPFQSDILLVTRLPLIKLTQLFKSDKFVTS